MNIRCAVDKYDRTMSTYIVAYLDILGVASKMKQKAEIQTESLNKLHNLYTSIIELADGEKGIEKYGDIKFRIFSDNIIIAKELSTNNLKRKADIECLLSCVSNFTCSTIGDGVGWLLRGGITIGDFYINDTIVWGPALLRAYELEATIANYPRIVLDTSILEGLNHCKEKSNFISLDHDGINYLNYMFIWSFSGEVVKTAFEEMKAKAKNPDGTYTDKIYQKLFWHMKYINGELDRKDERNERQYRLSI